MITACYASLRMTARMREPVGYARLMAGLQDAGEPPRKREAGSPGRKRSLQLHLWCSTDLRSGPAAPPFSYPAARHQAGVSYPLACEWISLGSQSEPLSC